MTSHAEIERTLAIVAATLNEQRLDGFHTTRVQMLVSEACAGGRQLTVDDGGGLHDETGARVGAIRRADSGEWITEPQNDTARRSHAPIPSKPAPSTLGSLLKKLKRSGS